MAIEFQVGLYLVKCGNSRVSTTPTELGKECSSLEGDRIPAILAHKFREVNLFNRTQQLVNQAINVSKQLTESL